MFSLLGIRNALFFFQSQGSNQGPHVMLIKHPPLHCITLTFKWIFDLQYLTYSAKPVHNPTRTYLCLRRPWLLIYICILYTNTNTHNCMYFLHTIAKVYINYVYYYSASQKTCFHFLFNWEIKMGSSHRLLSMAISD